MKPYLKSYQVTLQALGPVFIGSGREIGKKEYIFLTQQEAAVPDMENFTRRWLTEIKQRHLRITCLVTAGMT